MQTKSIIQDLRSEKNCEAGWKKYLHRSFTILKYLHRFSIDLFHYYRKMQSSQSIVIIILCCENKRLVNGNLAILKKLLVYFSQQFTHFFISNMYYPLYLQFKKLEIIRNRDL